MATFEPYSTPVPQTYSSSSNRSHTDFVVLRVKSLKARIDHEGLWTAVRDAAGTLLPTRLEVWKLASENVPQRNAVAPGGEILAGPPGIEKLKRLREAPAGLPVEFYRDEIDNIQSCFFTCADGRPAAIAWSYDHTKPAHFLRMSPGDAEIRSVYSLAEFRGRGLAKAVIASACDSLRRDGFQNIYAVIHFRNEASSRAFRSIGFTKAGELRRPPLFGPRFVTATGRAETWLGAIARIFR